MSFMNNYSWFSKGIGAKFKTSRLSRPIQKCSKGTYQNSAGTCYTGTLGCDLDESFSLG